MSKLFSSKRYFLKPIKQTINNDYLNQSFENMIDSYKKENPNIIKSFSSSNPNNITMEYPRHYSPSGKSFQSLPPISIKKRINNNSQKKPIKVLNNSNSTKNLYSQSLLGPGNKKPLEREKTQVNIIENNLGNNKSELNSIVELDDLNTGTGIKKNKLNNNGNGVTQINNITNINIHIYQTNTNNENRKQNSNNQDINNIENNNEILAESSPIVTEFNRYQNETPNIINNNLKDINNSFQNSLFKTKQSTSNNSFSSSLMGNAGLSIINTNTIKNNEIIF